jgi:mannose/cellobiose epimerase-like protein (N-acyl-D-glucosamine 2-epimerase family)|tara:strand:+ start:2559 stop:3773 length:1215 start_codon:yes stop_codon:yes gene_type:complete
MHTVQRPNFRATDFLAQHIQTTMNFYHPRAIDPKGGFFHYFRDDGSVYDAHTRHLVSSTRFIFNYSEAARYFGNAEYLAAARHGLDYLRSAHLNPQNGGYTWLIKDGQAVDQTNHCYGLAFVLLAYASAVKAGITEAQAYVHETFALMEQHFWLPEHGLYADEASVDWKIVSPYRGQNANMHSCEALIAAFEATGHKPYLDRAMLLAHNICVRQTQTTQGQIWEHYDPTWRPDWNYNQHDPQNLFRPWGYQPGHFTEWAKLLLILDRYQPKPWLLVTAKQLFDQALEKAWDHEYGGVCYGFSPSGDVCDADKYFWVQAESIAAAALLAQATGEQRYWDWYDTLWAYVWTHFVDHEYGAWYRILKPENSPYDKLKSPAGKTDYHTMGACYEVINSTSLSVAVTPL